MRRASLAWLVVLLVGAAATFHFAGQIVPEGEEHRADADRILPIQAADLRAIEIVVRGEMRRVERDAVGAWFYHRHKDAGAAAHSHVAAPAENEAIRQRVEMIARTQIDRRIAQGGADAARYGVQLPPLIAIFYGAAPTPVLRMQVGGATPDGHSRYVQIPERDAIVTVPTYQVDNLLRLFEDAGNAPS